MPDFILAMKKKRKSERKWLESHAPKRDSISTRISKNVEKEKDNFEKNVKPMATKRKANAEFDKNTSNTKLNTKKSSNLQPSSSKKMKLKKQ